MDAVVFLLIIAGIALLVQAGLALIVGYLAGKRGKDAANTFFNFTSSPIEMLTCRFELESTDCSLLVTL